MSIEFVDRRGQNKSEHVEKVLDVQVSRDEYPKEKSGWKDKITYFLALTPLPPNGAIVTGSAAAIRLDGLPFKAEYILPQPLWIEGFEWEPKAKDRLDTFLDCDCNYHSPCSTHQLLIQQWAQADMQRINLSSSEPIPEVLEILFKAEQARQKQILVPSINPNLNPMKR